jgi:hypothetical protein
MATERSERAAPDTSVGPPTPAAARPAFYALRPGGWRDYWTLLHPPYTLWHLSYVAIGAAAAPRFDSVRLAASVVGFFLGVGLCAHALDELSTRPLGTAISDRTLKLIAGLALAGSIALGIVGAFEVSWWLLAFVAFGAFIVVAYNLELLGGRFHSDVWFAVAWGAFPALTGYFAQDGTLGWPAVLVAAACLLLSVAQRGLSTPVRHLRRHVVALEGRMVLRDGREVPLDEGTLRMAPEGALRTLAAAMVLLASGLVAARMLL